MEGKRFHWTMLAVASLLMLAGSLLASFIHAGAGTASVSEVSIKDPPGFVTSAYLYKPSLVTPDQKLPAILVVHGLNNEKKFMANTALEFARRGYVVLSMDQPGHGRSSGVNGDNGGGAVGALRYLRQLPYVDTDNVGLVGMSQGGFLSATNAAFQMPEAYRSIFYMDSEVNNPGSFDLSRAEGLKNAAFSIGQVTELGVMIFVGKGTDAPMSPVLKPVFGTEEPIQVGRIYGSIAEGTARILYQPWGTHPGSTDSVASIGNALEWMGKTLRGGASIPITDQIWIWKFWGTTVALFGAFLFLFPATALFLRTKFFGSLVEEAPVFRGLRGPGWWLGAFLTTAVGPLLYLWAWKTMFFTPLITPNRLWPQNFTNATMVWGLVSAAVTIALIFLTHFLVTKKRGATAASYGLKASEGPMDWSKVGKSLLLSTLVVGSLYGIVAVVEALLKVDFRMWIVPLLPLTGARFQAFLGYLVPFGVIFLSQAALLAGLLRWREGKSSLVAEMVTNAIVLTLGALVWILLLYIPLFLGGPIVFASDPLGVTAAGMGGIYYIPLLLFWPLAACLYTYFFRKTGRIYLGVFLMTLLAVWQTTALGVMAFSLN